MTTPLHLSCYYDLRAWAKKHRQTLLVAAGIAGAGACAFYGFRLLSVKSKARKERDSAHMTLLQREAEDRAEAQLQSHFESIQRISDSTTLPSVLPHLKGRLFAQVDLSGLTEKLMLGKEDPQALSSRDKMQLWQELKTLSGWMDLSRFHTNCVRNVGSRLLDLFIRTQLNILGRHVYIDTARDSSVIKSGEQHRPLPMSCQHKFIAFADYLPYKGLDALIGDTHKAVESVLKGKPLKEPYTIDDLRDVFMRIRASLEITRVDWVQYVLPEDNMLPTDLEAASSAASSAANASQSLACELSSLDDREKLEQLLVETRAVLASNEFQEVLAVSLDAMLDGVMEELYTIYRGAPDNGIPLAKLLPPVASVGSTLLEHPDENRFIRILADLPQVQSLCAMVYTSSQEV